MMMQQIPRYEAVILPTPKKTLELVFKSTLIRWDRGAWSNAHSPGDDAGIVGVREYLQLSGDALSALDGRKGEREDDARKCLDAKRYECTQALETVERLGVGLDGPLAAELADKINSARSDIARAQDAFNRARPNEIVEARDELDRAQARGREFDRELQAVVAACKLPTIPRPEVFAKAKSSTLELDRAAKGAPARALHRALDQGLEAARDGGADYARLWVCFESLKPGHDLYMWRWCRYVEELG